MQTFWDNVLRVVAVIGLIAVLLLGAWGIIQIAFMLPSFFSGIGGSLFGRSAPTSEPSLSVSVPAAVVAGQAFTLTWRHTGAVGAQSYGISYSCAKGLSVSAPTPEGRYSAVECNTPFNYTNATGSLPLVATLADSTKSAQTTFSVVATNLSNNTKGPSGTAGTTVTAPAATAKPTTPSKPAQNTGSTYYPSGRTQNLYGYADLAVQITSAQSTGGNATVQFVVTNIGTNVSAGNWTLSATLPSGYVYPAGAQQALYPGDRIVYTLRYSEESTGYYGAQPQYPPCNGWTFPCTPPVTYGGPTSCNQYGPCTVPGYSSYNQVQNQYTYGSTGQGSWFFGNQRTVSIVVDPYNAIAEITKLNNSTSQTYIAY